MQYFEESSIGLTRLLKLFSYDSCGPWTLCISQLQHNATTDTIDVITWEMSVATNISHTFRVS